MEKLSINKFTHTLVTAMRIHLIIISLLLLSFSNAKDLKGSKPNIIFVLTDDQGMGDIACLGNPFIKTPHLDSFYKKAIRFTNYHVSPTCAPTRAALMSGIRPFEAGVTHTIKQRERMNPELYTLPEMLKSAGYSTGLFGKWHLGDDPEYLPQNRGFDEVLMHGAGGIGQVQLGDFPANKENCYFDNVLLHNDTVVKTKGFCTDLFFQAGLSWVKKQHEKKNPYFAYISLNAPHGPFIAPKKYTERFEGSGNNEKTSGRNGMIENIDDNFGLLMEKLTEWNALENTLVIFMTDNGGLGNGTKIDGKSYPAYNAGMKGRKNSANEGGARVPFFCYWKGKLAEGVDVKSLTAHLDIFSTFAELSGAKLPSEMQELKGRSLIPLMENPNAEWEDRELFIHCGRWNNKPDDSKYKNCAVRTAEWRLVNHTKLYNILSDPGEKSDVSDQHPEVVKKLQTSFDSWWSSALPHMINEGLPAVESGEWYLHKIYHKQLEETGIPDWAPTPY